MDAICPGSLVRFGESACFFCSGDALSWVENRDYYQSLAQGVCASSKLTTKDHWVWHAGAWFLCVMTMGQMKPGQFLNDYASTLGPIQAFPRQWTTISHRLLVHEARHSQQFEFAGWFVPPLCLLGPRVRAWVGILPMVLAYGLFPLPLFYCWGRKQLELDAEQQAWRMGLQQGWMTDADVRRRALEFAASVSSWHYGRAWPHEWTVQQFQSTAEAVISSAASRPDHERSADSAAGGHPDEPQTDPLDENRSQ